MIQKKTPNYPEKDLGQCHFIHNQSIIDWPKKETGTAW
jgi:hypothetical protein